MSLTRRGIRIPWKQTRFLLYLLVVAGLFVLRGPVGWHGLVPRGGTRAGDSLVVAGRDLAPDLIDRMAGLARRDDPGLPVAVRGGGTNHALEDLINRRANVAFLVRPPSPGEQRLFRSVDGDSADWFAVALGGIALVTGRDGTPDPVAGEDLRRILDGKETPRATRLYVPDPNRGIWDALRSALTLPPGEPDRTGGVVFLQDEAAVLDAVREDPGALGVASTLALPEALPPGTALAPVGTDGGEPALPTYESIASGRYPLIHALYAACRGEGDIQGAKFVTLLTGERGQRQVERAGYVPALLYLREVVLTTHPVGK